jgi:hypothetical protein
MIHQASIQTTCCDQSSLLYGLIVSAGRGGFASSSHFDSRGTCVEHIVVRRTVILEDDKLDSRDAGKD